MKISDYFKDQYKSPVIKKYLVEMIEEMTELKRLNYHDMLTVDKRNLKIKEIETALTELNIKFKTDWTIKDEFEYEHEDDYLNE